MLFRSSLILLMLATSKIREAKNANQNLDIDAFGIELNNEIGRASCRERV